MRFSFALILGLLLTLSVHAQNDELLAVTVVQTSSAATADEASKEITAKAISQAARGQVIDLIGEAKYQKNQKMIEAKIVREASKFIPFISPGQPVQTAEGYKMNVEMKVSEGSLRKMVLAAGLLAESETPGTVVSLVVFTDKPAAQSFRWWTGESDEGKKLLAQLNSEWQKILGAELAKKGFKLATNRAGASKAGEEKSIAQAYQAQMILKGEMRLRPTTTEGEPTSLAMKVALNSVKNDRLISDALRFDELEKASDQAIKTKATAMFSAIAADISEGVLEAWQKGIVSATALRISVRGSLTPRQLGEFKTELMRSVRDLKTLKERKFEAGRVVFEADYNGSVDRALERIKQASLPSFQLQGANRDENTIAVDVRARR